MEKLQKELGAITAEKEQVVVRFLFKFGIYDYMGSGFVLFSCCRTLSRKGGRALSDERTLFTEQVHC